MKFIVLIVSFLLLSCNKDPESISRTSNQNFNVEKLFEHEGCKIYRFSDGRDHYYSVCSEPSEIITEYNSSCGKSCITTNPDNVKTEIEY